MLWLKGLAGVPGAGRGAGPSASLRMTELWRVKRIEFWWFERERGSYKGITRVGHFRGDGTLEWLLGMAIAEVDSRWPILLKRS